MNESLETTNRAQASAGLRAVEAQQVSETEGARQRVEKTISQINASIRSVRERLAPVLRDGGKDEAVPCPLSAAAVTPMHGWLVNREDELRCSLSQLHDILDRLET